MSQVNHNYQYIKDVDGLTVWERLRVIRGFLIDRKQALAISEMNLRKVKDEWDNMSVWEQEEYNIMLPQQLDIIEDCKDEIAFLELFEKGLAIEAEKERIEGKTDREMYELNFAKEARLRLLRKTQSEMLSIGHVTPQTMSSLMNDDAVLSMVIDSGLLAPTALDAISVAKPKLLSILDDDYASYI